MSVRLGARECLRYIALTMDDVIVRSSLAAMSSNDGRFGFAKSTPFPTPSAA